MAPLVTINRKEFPGLFEGKFRAVLHVIPTTEEINFVADALAAEVTSKVEESLTPSRIKRMHADFIVAQTAPAAAGARPKEGSKGSALRAAG